MIVMSIRKSNSIEQKVWDETKPVREYFWDIAQHSTQAAYGFITLPLRIPTVTRRIVEKTDYLSRIKGRSESELQATSTIVGISLGVIGCGFTGLYLASKEIVEATQAGNYFPLVAIGATNLVSGIYEAVRKKEPNQEDLIKNT